MITKKEQPLSIEEMLAELACLDGEAVRINDERKQLLVEISNFKDRLQDVLDQYVEV